MFLRFFILISLLLVTAQAMAIEVTFLPEAEVSSDFITLGDIAKFDTDNETTRVLGAKVVLKSPEPGEQLNLRSADIIKDIYRKTTLSRDTRWTGSAVVTVARHGQQITPKMIKGEIGAYLERNKYRLPDADLRFAASSMPLPFKVPKGKLTWEIIPSSPSILDSTRIAVIIRVDGRVRENMSIPGKIEAMTEAVTASVPLQRGAILTPENTMLVRQDITELKNPCLNLRSVLGKRLMRSVRAGNVINTSDIEAPDYVKRGQLVKIILRRDKLLLTATGIAKSDGKLGEVIEVRNASSNKLIYCKISAPGIVEVMI